MNSFPFYLAETQILVKLFETVWTNRLADLINKAMKMSLAAHCQEPCWPFPVLRMGLLSVVDGCEVVV